MNEFDKLKSCSSLPSRSALRDEGKQLMHQYQMQGLATRAARRKAQRKLQKSWGVAFPDEFLK